MEVHVLPVSWDRNREVLREIRGAVFITEQGVAREIEWDGQDETARHFLAINTAGQRVGCARLLPSGQIGRMAVLPEFRRTGIGGKLLAAAVEEAKTLEYRQLFLHAQSHAESFYRSGGFVPVGDVFLEAGIEHLRMDLALPIPFKAQTSLPQPVIREAQADPQHGSGALLVHEGEAESATALIAVVHSARRHLRLYSQHLDPALFDDVRVMEKISAFARQNRPTTLRVLIHSSAMAVSQGHRLVELARRLESKIRIRLVPPELAVDKESYAIADERSLWLLPDHQEYEGSSNRYDPVQAKRLADRFDYLWDRSHADPELRTLGV